MVTNGITYGASQLTSDGVSYTKDGKVITVKSALDDLITKSSKVDELKKQVSDYKKLTIYLADNVQVGDYVEYDAGEWSNSADKTVNEEQFGGYTQGQSKNKSVKCDSGSTSLQGWRVFKIDTSSKTVTIVHAGQPECYHNGNSATTSITKLNDRASSQYINGKYATSARSLKLEDVEDLKKSNLLLTGAYYWLATSGSQDLYLASVYADGETHTNGTATFGFRPVVVLKPNILTTGKVKDMFGNDAWQLVEMK